MAPRSYWCYRRRWDDARCGVKSPLTSPSRYRRVLVKPPHHPPTQARLGKGRTEVRSQGRPERRPAWKDDVPDNADDFRGRNGENTAPDRHLRFF